MTPSSPTSARAVRLRRPRAVVSAPAHARDAHRGRRAGLTIVELLVTMTIMSVVGATLGVLLMSQFKLFNRTQAAVAVQRDLRTGLALLPLDLRGASRSLGDLTDLRDTAVQLRATIGSSVVCERPNSTTLVLPPLNLARNRLTTWYTPPKAGDTLWVYNDSISVGPEDDAWQPVRIAAIDTAPVVNCVAPTSPFVDAAQDPPATKPRFRVTLATALSPYVAVGAPIRFLRSARYSLIKSTSTPTRWFLGYREYVSGAWSTAEPIAGPFQAPGGTTPVGLAFAYYDTMGVALAANPVGTTVGRIDLVMRARTQVRGGRDSIVVRDSLAARVALRNRI